MQLLIVDDQVNALKTLKDMLLRAWPQAQIFRARKVSTALDIAAERELDLIISDWQMPQLSGLDLLAQLKELAPDIPVIIYSGLKIENEDLEQALEMGAIDYLRKPLEQTELTARVKAALRLSSAYLQLKQLNQSQDMVFAFLANHLVNDSCQLGIALNMIQKQLPEEQVQLHKILQQALTTQQSHQQRLENMLSWTRLLFGERQPYYQNCQIKKLIENTLSSFEHGHLRLRSNRELCLSTDVQILDEILNFLIGRAVSRCPQDEVRIQVQDVGAALRIEVRDYGPTLLAEELACVLNPILNYGLLGEFNLQGLGLQICHENLRLLGSKLQGCSKPGQGTRLWFDLKKASP